MDDLFQNVWNDAASPSIPEPSPWSPPASRSLPVSYDSEGTSSWANDSETRWEAPSATALGHSWLQSGSDPVWGSGSSERTSSGAQQTSSDHKHTFASVSHDVTSTSKPSSLSLVEDETSGHQTDAEVADAPNFESVLPINPSHSAVASYADAEIDPWTSAWAVTEHRKEGKPVDEWNVGNTSIADDVDTSFGSFYVAPIPTKAMASKPQLIPRSSHASSQVNPVPVSPTASYATAGSSSASPTSSVPLSELYPNAVSLVGSAQTSPQSQKPTSTSPLLPDAPAKGTWSQKFTRTWARNPPIPSSSSNTFGDLSDFLTPSNMTSPPVPSPIEKSPRTLAAAGAAKAALRSPPVRSNTAPIFFPLNLPPPPSSSVPDRASSAAPPTASLSSLSLDNNDDDFADFLSSPTTTNPHLTPSTSLGGSSSAQPLLASTSAGNNSLDGLSDFLESLSPEPPSVPAKDGPEGPSPSSPTGASSTFSRLFRRRPTAAQHLRTLSLVEKAAAKKGQQWPAPPSPLPAAIPGPSGSLEKASLIGLMDDDADDDDQPLSSSISALPQLTPSLSSPAMLVANRPSSNMGGPQPLVGIGLLASEPITTRSTSSSSLSRPLLGQGWSTPGLSGLQRTSTPPLVPSTAGTARKPASGGGGAGKASGLSAQDLAFFEGL